MKRLLSQYPYFVSERQRENFWNDLNDLVSPYKTEISARDLRYGTSLSYCLDNMRDKGWKGLSNVHKLQTVAEMTGFKVLPCWDKQFNEVNGRFCIIAYKKNVKGGNHA
jgi:hypothetical protein